jgi:hypothetical protein
LGYNKIQTQIPRLTKLATVEFLPLCRRFHVYLAKLKNLVARPKVLYIFFKYNFFSVIAG